MEKYCPKCFRKYPTAVARCEDDGARLISLGDEDLVGGGSHRDVGIGKRYESWR